MTNGARVVDDDRLFWEIQRRYEARPMVCGVLLPLAGPPDRARLQAGLQAAVEAHPRLGCRIVDGRDGPRWEPCSRDRTATATVTWEHDPSLRDDADMLRRVALRMNDRLPADGPPWQCRIVGDRPEGDRSGRVHGVFIRWQHALTDGEGMLDLVAALCAAPEHGADLRASSPATMRDRKPTLTGESTEGAGTKWTRSGSLRRLLKERGERARGQPTRTNPGGHATEVRRIELPLRHEHLLALAGQHGVSTNDVVLSATAWVIEQHRERLGERGPAAILSPVSRRAHGSGVVLGNRSHALRMVLEGLPRDPSARIATVGARSAASMASAGAIPYWVYGALFRLPRRVLDRVLAATPPYICNYLPWADRPQALAGQSVTAIHGFTPLLPYHGCTFAYCTHDGRVTCTVTTDPTILSEADAMMALLEEATHALARIVPGDHASAAPRPQET